MSIHGGPYPVYTLYRTRGTPHTYRLRTAFSVMTRDNAIVWCLETEDGVFVTPEAGLTGLHFYWDEVVSVEVLPVGE